MNPDATPEQQAKAGKILDEVRDTELMERLGLQCYGYRFCDSRLYRCLNLRIVKFALAYSGLRLWSVL